MVPRILCAICQETYDIDQFRFLTCGHGLCVACTAADVGRRNCAVCRVPKQGQVPHQIFLSMDEEETRNRRPSAVHDLSTSSSSSNPLCSGDIEMRMKRAIEKTIIEEDDAEKLLRTARKLDKKLNDLLSELATNKREKADLRRMIVACKQKVDKMETLQAKMHAQKLEISELQGQVASSATLEHRLKIALDNQKAANERHRAAQKVDRATLVSKDVELVDLHVQLQRKDQKIKLLKTKLRALGDPVKTKRAAQRHQRPGDPGSDDSLVIF